MGSVFPRLRQNFGTLSLQNLTQTAPKRQSYVIVKRAFSGLFLELGRNPTVSAHYSLIGPHTPLPVQWRSGLKGGQPFPIFRPAVTDQDPFRGGQEVRTCGFGGGPSGPSSGPRWPRDKR